MIRSPSRRHRRRSRPPARKELAIAPVVHDHGSNREEGRCPRCRADNVRSAGSCAYGYVLGFPDADAIAIVRTDFQDDGVALETAWQTGCNGGGFTWIVDLPVELIENSGTPTFQLMRGPTADAAAESLGLTIHREEHAP